MRLFAVSVAESENIVDLTLDTYRFGHEERRVSVEDLPAVYAHLQGSDAAAITWNNGGEQVLIVSVGDDDSTVSLLNDSTWYYLVISPEQELVEIELCGQEAWVPKGAILPKELGLDVLLGAHDFPRLLKNYSWREQ